MSEMQPLLDEAQATELNNLLRTALNKYPNFMEILHQLGRKNTTTLEIYDYLLSIGKPVTVKEIQNFGCHTSLENIYRTIKKLRELGLVASTGYRIKKTRRVLTWMAF